MSLSYTVNQWLAARGLRAKSGPFLVISGLPGEFEIWFKTFGAVVARLRQASVMLKVVTTSHQEVADICGFTLSSVCVDLVSIRKSPTQRTWESGPSGSGERQLIPQVLAGSNFVEEYSPSDNNGSFLKDDLANFFLPLFCSSHFMNDDKRDERKQPHHNLISNYSIYRLIVTCCLAASYQCLLESQSIHTKNNSSVFRENMLLMHSQSWKSVLMNHFHK